MINLLFSSRIAGIALIIAGYLYLLGMAGKSLNAYLFLTNLVIVILGTTFSFSNSKRPFSLFKVIFLFYVIFFGFAPLLEYKVGLQYWGGSEIKDSEYLITNFALIFTMILYVFFYHLFSKGRANNYFFNRLWQLRPEASPTRLVTLCVTAFVAILFYYNFDIMSLAFRGGDFDLVRISDDKTMGLVVGNFLRPLVFNCFAAYILTKKGNRFSLLLLLILAICGASPTALPRFASATLLISLLLIYIWRGKSDGFHLNNILLFGFIFVFPLLDAFRFFVGLADMNFRPSFDFLIAGHFDAYQNMTRVIDSDIITGGSQLLGVFFFFVPRALWPDKPVGSGELLAQEIGLQFSNIAMPFLGEGYINFGWFGMFAFVVVLAFCTARLDRSFWHAKQGGYLSLFPLAYMQLIGLVFFIMRGDLLSSFAYTCGILASLVTIAFTLRLPSLSRLLKLKTR